MTGQKAASEQGHLMVSFRRTHDNPDRKEWGERREELKRFKLLPSVAH